MRISDWSSDVCSSDLRDARLNMMSASMQGAMAFQKGLGCVHSLSHSLGGINPKLHHGTLNAIFLPAVIAFNSTSDSVRNENKLARIAQAMRSEEHTSELQSLMRISYAVFCLKKIKNIITSTTPTQSLNKTSQHYSN